MCIRSCGSPDLPSCVQWQRRWHRAGVVSSWSGLQRLLHGGLLQLRAAVWGWEKTHCYITYKSFDPHEFVQIKKMCLGVYRAPERPCPTAAEHYSASSVRCREPPFTQHPSHMPLERFLQSQGSNSSTGNNTYVSIAYEYSKTQKDYRYRKKPWFVLTLLRWQWRSERVRRGCQPGGLPMVSWYTVPRSCSSVGACRRGQEPRSLRDSTERDAAGGVRPHLQLSGQSQGETIRERRHIVMLCDWVVHSL